mmetsp:Transcript_66820/g.59925  ORF Transcript_66820/g.59925 Transcript_66820/m.59925 type:complete len:388 (+) Transcript_66820:84-1247(+)
MNNNTELNNGSYLWNITDSKIIEKIDKIEPGERLDSEIFEIASSKWFLRLFPNGTKRKYEGRVSLFLQLCSLPLYVKKLKVKLILTCKETNTQYSDIKYFSNSREFGGWTGGILTTNELKKYNKLTFTVNIFVIEKIGTDAVISSVSSGDDSIQQQQQQQQQIIGGGIHPQYVLQKQGSYSHHSAQQQLQIQQPQVQMHPHPQFQQGISMQMHAQPSFVEIQLNQLSMNINTLSQSMKQITDLIQNMNSNIQQKQSNIGKIQKDLQKIKKKLEIEDDEEEDDETDVDSKEDNESSLYLWLKNDVKLDEYYETFIENGLEDMSIITALTEKELDLIGITKLGHKIKIIQEINKYKESEHNRHHDDIDEPPSEQAYQEPNKSVEDIQIK